MKIEYDMSPLRGPWLQDKSAEILRLKFLLGGLALALFGLLYIFGQRAWLPRMGGQFARTYRQLRKLPDTAEGAQQAVSLLHQALNTSAGYTVFGNTIEKFLQKIRHLCH